MTSPGPYRRHSMLFKLQLCQDIRNGVVGRREAEKTYGISANLIQLWLTQFDHGALNNEETEASVIAELAAILDACGRKVLGYTLSMRLDTPLALAAFGHLTRPDCKDR